MDGFLELLAFEEYDSIKVGAVGTQGRFMTKYGFFEYRAQLITECFINKGLNL